MLFGFLLFLQHFNFSNSSSKFLLRLFRIISAGRQALFFSPASRVFLSFFFTRILYVSNIYSNVYVYVCVYICINYMYIVYIFFILFLIHFSFFLFIFNAHHTYIKRLSDFGFVSLFALCTEWNETTTIPTKTTAMYSKTFVEQKIVTKLAVLWVRSARHSETCLDCEIQVKCLFCRISSSFNILHHQFNWIKNCELFSYTHCMFNSPPNFCTFNLGNAWIYGEISEGIYFLATKSLRSNTILFIFLLVAKSIDFNVHLSNGFYLYFTKCNFNRIFNGNIHFIRQFSRLFVIFFCVCNRKSTAHDKTKMLSKLLFFFFYTMIVPFLWKSQSKWKYRLCYHCIWSACNTVIALLPLNLTNFSLLSWRRFACSVIYVQTLEIVWIERYYSFYCDVIQQTSYIGFFWKNKCFFSMIRCWSSKFYFDSKRFFFSK